MRIKKKIQDNPHNSSYPFFSFYFVPFQKMSNDKKMFIKHKNKKKMYKNRYSRNFSESIIYKFLD